MQSEQLLVLLDKNFCFSWGIDIEGEWADDSLWFDQFQFYWFGFHNIQSKNFKPWNGSEKETALICWKWKDSELLLWQYTEDVRATWSIM